MADILVVDDDQSVAARVRAFSEFRGPRLSDREQRGRRDAADWRHARPALVMMDVRMPGVDGLQALNDDSRHISRRADVVMMTGYGTSQTSIDAIRAGAFDYLTKPLDLEEIRAVIRKAIDAQQTRTSAEGSRPAMAEPLPRLVGSTRGHARRVHDDRPLAGIDVPALVIEQTGTGKQLVIATHSREQRPRAITFRVASTARRRRDAAIERALFAAPRERCCSRTSKRSRRRLQVTARARASAIPSRDRRSTSDLSVRVRVIASTEWIRAVGIRSGSFAGAAYRARRRRGRTAAPARPPRRHPAPRSSLHSTVQREFDRRSPGRTRASRLCCGNHRGRETSASSNGRQTRLHSRAQRRHHQRSLIGESLSRRRFPERREVESALVYASRTALQERLVDAPAGDSSAPAITTSSTWSRVRWFKRR